jgi:predicted nucleotidyltransferase
VQDIFKRLDEQYKIIQSRGHETVGIFLQGSQNYNLDYEGSDIDTKVIVLPKFNNFVLGSSMTSTTSVMDNDEHVDLKDIRLMFDCFRKQNINFVEILFTKYKILNSKYEWFFQPMFDNRELIARYNNYAAVNCIAGMSMEKYKALEHPYPTIVDKIKKYGYDPKQLHHIIRLNEFIKRFIDNSSYAECLISKQRDYLIEVKKGIHTLEEAREIAETLSKETSDIRKEYMLNNPLAVNKEVENIMNDVLLNIMRWNFKTEIGGV